ncbi:DUF5320 domain-containing protein [Roseimarinus sediminis]|uniref:DUF5320 domain-containing protein n=1 Tax=Roseimarinus sediminis TaxID=1610899 RepID=UPI003D24343E
MARGDKTGPMGQGSMTGRSLGYCAGYDSPGFTSGFGGGRGQGRGFGSGGQGRGSGGRRGRGRGFAFNAGYTNAPQTNSNDEILNLKAQAESLKKAQEEIERRLKDLENN